MEKIHKLERPLKDEILSYFVLSDVHSEFMDNEAFETFKRFVRKTPKQQRRIILLGDILDLKAFVTKSDEYKAAKKMKDFDGYFIPSIQEEYDWFEWFLKELMTLVDDYSCIVYAEGNHEERVRRPEFLKIVSHDHKYWFDVPKRLKLKERGIKWIKYNDWLQITSQKEKMLLTHGIFCGLNPIRKHFDVAKVSCMFGHTHEAGLYSAKGINNAVISYNNPCLCDLNPKYIGGRPTNWSTGFSSIHVSWYKIFANVHVIQNGELIDQYGRYV